MARTSRGRLLAAAGLVVLGLLGGPGAAGADPAPDDEVAAAQVAAVGDPGGDTDPGGECRADILGFGVDYTPVTVSMYTDLACGSNPNSDPSWVTGITYVSWDLDTDADDFPEFAIDLFNDGSVVKVTVFDYSTGQAVPCATTPGWNGAGRFSAEVGASCIGSPSSLRAGAYAQWDENPFGDTCTCPSDIAPNAAPYWGPRVLPTYHPLPLGDGPAAVATGGGAMDVFARGADNALWTRHFDGSVWGGWTSLGGIILGVPAAVSVAPGEVDVFVRGADNALWAQHFNGSTWSGWASRGGVLSTPPAVTSPAPGAIQVFVAGSDRALYTQRFVGLSGSGWQNLGGVIVGVPAAVSRNAEQMELYVRGTDDRLYRQPYQNGTWFGWQQIGGIFISSSPGAVALNSFDSLVYARGGDGALWRINFTNLIVGNWQSEGGIIYSAPSPVNTPSGPVIFAKGADNALWQRTQGNWSSLGGIIQ